MICKHGRPKSCGACAKVRWRARAFPLTERVCGCGCRRRFKPSRFDQQFAHRGCRQRAHRKGISRVRLTRDSRVRGLSDPRARVSLGILESLGRSRRHPEGHIHQHPGYNLVSPYLDRSLAYAS